MTDKELIELAAKAADLSLLHPDKDGDEYLLSYGKAWNPLTDDGDALRLAVKLSILSSPAVLWAANDASCPYAAARRAIVRAAAEIGRKL